ncbi:MAG TPA: HlyC/CorC family transporter [Rhizomicrobium sp.]|jgi:Mg2+/Co2+ transporter CorB|nr:HlyC/CorC family transporter [Rhizomicrobium sp.]
MDTVVLISLAPIAILLALGAFFAGSETALTAVSRGRMHQLEKDGSRAARDVNHLMTDRERMVGALLLGNTFVNILASSLATTILERSFGARAVYVATAVMTVLILFFVEVLPKTLAIARTDRFALFVATPVRFVVSVLAPVVNFVQFLVWRFLGLFGVRVQDEELVEAHEEIRGTVEIHHKEGTVEREHRDMIGGILDLRELTIGDVMIHRKNMMTIDAGLPPQQILKEVLAAKHTRIPLWREQPENIVGILHTKDIVRTIIERGRAGFDVAQLASEPWFVPETTTLEEQLVAFRDRRSHFALVVDEYGALQGLISLEDILDEIFGDIPDEHEEKGRPDVRKRPDGSYLIDGAVPIRELNRELDWNLPDEEATTIAGLVIHEARTIPDAGQRFAFFGYQFEILRRHRNQITALKVTPPTPAQTVDATSG